MNTQYSIDVEDKIDVVSGLVSTIIPVFNRSQMLRTAIDSVLNQSYKQLEIIIADDGSTDDTPQVCHELSQQYPEVIRFTRITNSGPGPAREAGRILARGEFIQYLDSDDRLTPNKFADQVALLNKHPEIDIAYGITNLVDIQGNILQAEFKWTNRDFERIYPGLLVDRWWCTHTPLYRRTLTDQIGSWSKLRWSQDWEYDARAGALNAKIMSCKTHVSDHVHHEGVRQTSKADLYSDSIRVKNRVELLTALWKNYRLSNLTEHRTEVAHFSRWTFFVCRSAAKLGFVEESRTMLAISEEAARLSGATSKLIPLFRSMSQILGYSTTGQLFQLAQNMKPGRSKYSQKQSFEN